MEDPYLYLGYGVNAYFGTMFHLVKMFAVISIFCIPILGIYRKNETNFYGRSSQAALRYTLGNLGGATSICSVSPFETKEVSL